MPEIIDILAMKPSGSPYFTVDIEAAYVDLQRASGGDYKFYNTAGNANLKNGDSFSILSAGIVAPESFTFRKDSTSIEHAFAKSALEIIGKQTGYAYYADVLGYGNYISIPMENYEIALDVFIDARKQQSTLHPSHLLDEDFFLIGNIADASISMLNIPASYNGKSFFLSPFFKILHNFPMF